MLHKHSSTARTGVRRLMLAKSTAGAVVCVRCQRHTRYPCGEWRRRTELALMCVEGAAKSCVRVRLISNGLFSRKNLAS